MRAVGCPTDRSPVSTFRKATPLREVSFRQGFGQIDRPLSVLFVSINRCSVVVLEKTVETMVLDEVRLSTAIARLTTVAGPKVG